MKRIQNLWKRGCLLASALFTFGTTHALPITWYYEGTLTAVTRTEGGWGEPGNIQPGDVFHGSLTFNGDATPVSLGPNSILVSGPSLGLIISTIVGETEFHHAGLLHSGFSLQNNSPAAGTYRDTLGALVRADADTYSAVELWSVGTSHPDAVTSLNFPPAIPNPSEFDQSRFWTLLRDPSDAHRSTHILGNISTFSLNPFAVPETGGTLPLMLAGIGSLVFFAKRQTMSQDSEAVNSTNQTL